MKKESLPEFMCLVGSVCFMTIGTPIFVFYNPTNLTLILVPLFSGLFLFLLSLILTLDRKLNIIKQENNGKELQ